MKKKFFSLVLLLGLIPCLLLAGCKKAPEVTIENRDKVTLTYDSYLEDGEIVEEGVTQTILIGWQDSFPIFDVELLGMKVGEQKVFKTRNPSDGYGIYHEEGKVKRGISSTIIYQIGMTSPKEGDPVNLGSIKGVLLNVSPTTVDIDTNDRQTRENVEFHVTVLSIEKNANE